MRSGVIDPWLTIPPIAARTSGYRDWLTDRGSLTARVMARCGHFHVEVVRETLLVPFNEERHLVQIRLGEKAWVREVLLVADGTPVVFARSVLPRQSLDDPWRLIAGMGCRPLGAALFNDPRIARGALHFTRLAERHPLYRRTGAFASKRGAGLWARRSSFWLKNSPLWVTEVFLPAVCELRRSV